MIEADFQPGLERFEAEAVRQSVHLDAARLAALSIQFADLLERGTVGLCAADGETYDVWVDRAYWTRETWIIREALLNHELGHCLLDRVHRSDFDTALGIPASIMYPEMRSDLTYSRNWSYYMLELFTYK